MSKSGKDKKYNFFFQNQSEKNGTILKYLKKLSEFSLFDYEAGAKRYL